MLLCAVAEEALDIPGVEVVRVAPLPPAAPSPEAAAYAATLVNVSLELQLAGGALVGLVSSAAIATFWTPSLWLWTVLPVVCYFGLKPIAPKP